MGSSAFIAENPSDLTSYEVGALLASLGEEYQQFQPLIQKAGISGIVLQDISGNYRDLCFHAIKPQKGG